VARPRKPDAAKREVKFTVRFRPQDMRAVEDRAAKAGLSPTEYVRRQALCGRVVSDGTRRADPVLVMELNRIGVNLNQLVRKANATGEILSARVEPLCAQIADFVMKAIEADHDPDNRAGRQQL
jgi:hypothetical protein